MSQTQTLARMPPEILSLIFQYLTQQDHHSLLLTHPNLTSPSATHLYKSPIFASVYRFAQFTHTISHLPYYAHLVHSLNLSYLSTIGYSPKTGELTPTTGWREWKYRFQDLYNADDLTWSSAISPIAPSVSDCRSVKGDGNRNRKSSHPPPSPFLKSFHLTRDVPFGALCHIVAACTRLQHLDLSTVQLAADFVIDSSTVTASKQVYISDTAQPLNGATKEMIPIYAEDVVLRICELRELKKLEVRGCGWLSMGMVGKLQTWENEGGGVRKVEYCIGWSGKALATKQTWSNTNIPY